MPGINLLDEHAVQGRARRFSANASRTTPIDLNDPAANLRWRWMIDGRLETDRARPDRTSRTAKVELYNLAADPHETENLAASDRAAWPAAQHARRWWNPAQM